MRQTKSKIIFNRRVKERYFHLAIDGRGLLAGALPGMFLEIKVNNFADPLLRRPFGIHKIRGNRLDILYEAVGKGTQCLSNKMPGEYLDIIGPLGNGFNYRRQRTGNKGQIIVAGGIGVAPLTFLAEKLAGEFKIIVLIGAKNKKHILCEKEFRGLGCDVRIATDDGSKGFRGKATDLLKQLLRTTDYGLRTIYACGPKPMLKGVSDISRQYKIPAQLLLEAHMACGIGACLGCAVQTTAGSKRVCKDGPVFSADGIIW